MKRYILYALILLTFVMLVLLHPVFNKGHNLITYYHYLVRGNDLELAVSEGIDNKLVEIIWEGETDLYIRSEKLSDPMAQYIRKLNINYVAPVVVFSKGEEQNEIPFDYGKQVLIVLYKGKEIGQLGQLKFSGWHSHTYKIELNKIGGSVSMCGEIIGPDERKRVCL